MTEKDSSEQKFGIKTVSQLTGISQHLLRMWERRYNVVTAHRSESGRRRYSDADVDRLLLIKHLVDCGEAIGQVAGLDTETLRTRSSAMRSQADARQQLTRPQQIRVAVLGDYLPHRLERSEEFPPHVEIVTRCASIPRFRADIRSLEPDALIVETAVLNTESCELIREMIRECGANRVIMVYGFGRRAEIDLLQAQGVRAVRSPTTLGELFELLSAPASRPRAPVKKRQPPSPEFEISRIPPRRFDEQELARLANHSTTVECECPHHLVELVMSLNAFETYSAACESKDDKDAALHAYLHATTAQARSRIEQALEKVARVEGLLD